MSLWALIKNAGAIFSFFNIVSGILKESVKGKKLPECENSKQLIKSVRVLLDKGVIDIPDVDEREIAQALLDIENQITCKI